jgi:hypothetical protein
MIDDTNNMNDDLEVSNLFLGGSSERLILPRRGSMTKLDEYLSGIPRVVSRAGEVLAMREADCSSLLSQQLGDRPQQLLSSSLPLPSPRRRCLNVLQGEMAHVSAHQADVVVSAEATTCHVVALRSTKSASVPLVSLAHVDQVYDACLEDMLKEHIEHHADEDKNKNQAQEADDDFGFFMEEEDEHDEQLLEVSSNTSQSYLPGLSGDHHRATSMPNLLHVIDQEPIEMELHMVGGYLDKEGASQQLSTALIERFNELAYKYRNKLKISLSTAAISCMNNENETTTTTSNDHDSVITHRPRSRGLGIDTRTGEVFPVKGILPVHLEGPALEVRSARAFAEEASNTASSLAVIHDKMCIDGEIRIQPFRYERRDELDILLQVPDDVLLSVTSTSPDQESDRFCTNFRRTLSFVNTVPPETVFENNLPLVYARSSDNLNQWEARPQQQQDTLMY